jgi:hypothetical protein
MLKVGADPELFVSRRGGEGFIPAEGLVQGTKKNPQKVEFGAVQVDGMALEFNIDPADNVEDFLRNIDLVQKTLAEMIGPDLILNKVPVALFSDKQWDEVSLESAALGCDPDYNAYLMDTNEPPNPNVPFRTAAGHIHIGWDEDLNIRDENHFQLCGEVVRQLDCLVGCWSVLHDDDKIRRSLYGKAGAFRPKSYGVEYRTLSNFWLRDEHLTRSVYDLTTKAVEDLNAGKSYLDIIDDPMEMIDAINSGNRPVCGVIFNQCLSL